MTPSTKFSKTNSPMNEAGPEAVIEVAPSPHISETGFSTRRMMFDVMLALLPLIAVGVSLFRRHAVFQIVLSVIACVAAEALFCFMRKRKAPLGDGSAVVTGLILGLSLPPVAPWYVSVIGGFAAIGFGKAVFGGLGHNLFNPAMVGRAFVMIAFPAALGAGAYILPDRGIDALTHATPLTAWMMEGESVPLGPLFLGWTGGSVGETSALAALAGGIYLCLRRTASWEIPAGALGSVVIGAGLIQIFQSDASWTVLHHLSAGALMFGAFFIATDPVSSPLTPKGKFVFGFGFGTLVLLMRTLSGYPEGVMFSILIMNAFTPLINRGTVPTPVGGPVKTA